MFFVVSPCHSRVLRRSDLFQKIAENEHQLFPNNTFIIDDSAYPVLSWLVPPFKNYWRNALTQAEKDFNFIHSSTRMVVENTFGLLKSSFTLMQLYNCKRLRCSQHLHQSKRCIFGPKFCGR